ncbi:MAG TPA: DUF2271 domain-containing protein, partial [Steroidobacteraceae bacterium]|nr:DUF2271 domain-containing protein [Steroidobacteraceae bacterium]
KGDAIAFADQHGIAARIETADEVLLTKAAQEISSPVRFLAANTQRAKMKSAATNRWPKDWVALITFTAPPRQLVRDQYFRSPYMAMWITDVDNRPIRTLLLVGTHLDWQQDNYIWWAINNDNSPKLAATRSMSTSGSGIYKVLWDGTDDKAQEVPAGPYVLHIETSRERGKHTHRSLTLDFTKPREFNEELSSTEEAGGVRINFYHP